VKAANKMSDIERNERLVTIEDLEAEHLPLETVLRIMGIIAVDHAQETLPGMELPQGTLF